MYIIVQIELLTFFSVKIHVFRVKNFDVLKNEILKKQKKKQRNFKILKTQIIEFIQPQFQIHHLDLLIHHQINQCLSFSLV